MVKITLRRKQITTAPAVVESVYVIESIVGCPYARTAVHEDKLRVGDTIPEDVAIDLSRNPRNEVTTLPESESALCPEGETLYRWQGHKAGIFKLEECISFERARHVLLKHQNLRYEVRLLQDASTIDFEKTVAQAISEGYTLLAPSFRSVALNGETAGYFCMLAIRETYHEDKIKTEKA